ncbi:TetR/AcrR family transcriptional regulator [Gordonia crocea]|uniref:Putative transcriptional regulator, TetR family protein n=1 Tax=Gordonia crocea TaxID=589162 RepID=A0A7I9UYR9_9ACTN|nr:hypothetical protein [Gordonia crocea]GED97950.1 putative transcriptional regulator, TetR family protein [Gordonia crocea]
MPQRGQFGSRGLTHRAVDRHLKLPEGSTSAYFRTRASLLTAATQRLGELDLASIEGLTAAIPTVADKETPGRLVAAIVDDWTAPSAAPRQLARIELQLEGVRTPDVAAALANYRAAFIGLAQAVLEARVVSESDTESDTESPVDVTAMAGVLTAVVDGLIADRLLHGRTAVRDDRLVDTLDQLLFPLHLPSSPAAAADAAAQPVVPTIKSKPARFEH